jgi:hypothetical protein
MTQTAITVTVARKDDRWLQAQPDDDLPWDVSS